MELTREQAIAEHRKMWQWITEHYEKNSIYSLDLYTLKNIFVGLDIIIFIFVVATFCVSIREGSALRGAKNALLIGA